LENVTTIKQRTGKMFGAAAVGPAWKLLDPSLK
jgi:hypothetical protein